MRDISIHELIPKQDNTDILKAIEVLANAIQGQKNDDLREVLSKLSKKQATPAPIDNTINFDAASIVAAIKEKQISNSQQSYEFDIKRGADGKIVRVIASPIGVMK